MDWNHLSFFFDKWRIELIGVIGTVIGVLSKRQTLPDKCDVVVYLLSGFALAHIYTEPVRQFLNLQIENGGGVSFLLGLLGGEIVAVVFRVFRQDYIVGIIKSLIKRKM